MAVSDKQKASAAKYKAKRDNCMIYLPAGTAAAVRAQGESVSGLCGRLLSEWLAARGVLVENPATGSAVDQDARTAKNSNTKPQPIQEKTVQGSTNPIQATEKGKCNNIGVETETTPTGAGSVSPSDYDGQIIDIDTFL